MMSQGPVHADVSRRHDFVLLFDVQYGDPNGDPDAGGQPRTDPETMHGLVTDVALKRKVRDFVDVAREGEARFKIYIQRETNLTETRGRVFAERSLGREGLRPDDARQWMCSEFYDIRMFGAVMRMRDHNAGQVRGPVQLTFARSIDPIFPIDSTITRVALERRGDSEETEKDVDPLAPTHGTFGRKSIVPYGLYRAHGFFKPNFAWMTGVDGDDLSLLWEALVSMWDLDRAAARGLMSCRGLYVFSHDSALGNAPAHRLFESVEVGRREGVDVPRSFGDYRVESDEEGLPNGVVMTRLDN